jgi:Holliday junction resolvase RusA-like endonuclease
MRPPVVIEFEIVGEKPATQGSKNPVIPHYGDGRPVRRHKKGCPAFNDKKLARDGQPDASGDWSNFECECPIMVNVVDDNPHLSAWRETVGWHARVAYKGEVLDAALAAHFIFVQPRPKAHYGTGRNERVLKDSAPAYPEVKPDTLKLARAVEDGLSGIVYQDDSLIVDEFISKRYCDRWEPYRVCVKVVLTEAQTVGDLVEMGVLEPPAADEVFTEQLALIA